MKIVHSQKNKEKLVVQAEQKKEATLQRVTLFPGHSLFELNMKTGQIDKCRVEGVIGLDGKTSARVPYEQGCIYVSALNFKNAEKHFIKKLQKLKDIRTQKTVDNDNSKINEPED